MWTNFFRYPYIPITLPESYTNLFTWEEQVRALIDDVYRFVDYVNGEFDKLELDVDNKIQAEVGKAMYSLQKQIDDIKDRADEVYNSLNNEINALRRDVAGTIQLINTSMSQLRDSLERQMMDLDTSVDRRLQVLRDDMELQKGYLLVQIANAELSAKRYADSIVASERTDRIKADNDLFRLINNLQFKLPEIYNPATGHMDKVGQTICDLYNYLGKDGLRIDQIESMDIPVSYFNDNNIKVEYIDLRMGWDIDLKERNMMVSPFTGNKERYSKVIYDIVKYLNINNKKVDIFANNDITVDTVDGSDYDVYKMGVTQWVDSKTKPSERYNDIKNDHYKLLWVYNTPTQGEMEIPVPYYPYYTFEVVFVNIGQPTQIYTVKANTKFDLSLSTLQHDIGDRDALITLYRPVEIRKLNDLCSIRLGDSYLHYNGSTNKNNQIVVTKIWGVDRYDDITQKED